MSSSSCPAPKERQTEDRYEVGKLVEDTLRESVRYGFVLSENGLSGYCLPSTPNSEAPQIRDMLAAMQRACHVSALLSRSKAAGSAKMKQNPSGLPFLCLAPRTPK